ncbi:MAG: PQQ-dependent sugar dehydrogenase [Thermoproteota archaeon]|nr:PQQ-dependent sugar dehydrogenase [Thermoproteota archaeon]
MTFPRIKWVIPLALVVTIITVTIFGIWDIYSITVDSLWKILDINAGKKPLILNQGNDNNLTIEHYASGLSFPTSMAFVDNNNIMVLEKNEGTVRLVSNGVLQKEPLLKINTVDKEAERGLLGIEILKKDADKGKSGLVNGTVFLSNFTTNTHNYSHGGSNYFVYLYFSEKTVVDDERNLNNFTRNRIYKYSWDGSGSLKDPRLIMDLPANIGPYHNGGKLKIGPDNQLYAVIGDLVTINNTLQNRFDGSNTTAEPNNSSVILRIDPLNGIFSNDNPFSAYYHDNKLKSLAFYHAYGIRNSFGMDFDPVTGTLWDTENGEDKFDEINIVEPGFNSGWHKVMGPIAKSNNNNLSLSDLVMFNGSHYSDPVFSWYVPVGVTDIEFFESEKLGKKYENNVFVGDINNGNLYFFEVNSTRTGFDFSKFGNNGPNQKIHEYQVADNKTESDQHIFARGFEGRITDIETGPDGYLYILTYIDGRIFRIL